MVYQIPRTVDEYIRQQAILKQAKSGIKKEKKENIKKNISKGYQKTKKIISNVGRAGEKAVRKSIKGITKAYKYNPKLSKNLLSIGFGNQSSTNQSNRPVGRPIGSLKWRSPFTGQPIPATEYYKQIREFKRLQSQRAEQIKRQMLQKYAQQGVPPTQAQQLQTVQQPQQQVRQTQQVPNPYNRQLNIQEGVVVPPNNPTIWRGRRGVVGKDFGLFGPREVVYGLPESFFN